MSKLTTIEGIGPTVEARLKKTGIGSVEKLLEVGGTAAGRKKIAEESGIASARVLTFVNHADLMRVKGIGGEYAELLEAAGVDSVMVLAKRNPENLTKALATANDAKSLVRSLPSLQMVIKWVTQAKELDRAVSH